MKFVTTATALLPLLSGLADGAKVHTHTATKKNTKGRNRNLRGKGRTKAERELQRSNDYGGTMLYQPPAQGFVSSTVASITTTSSSSSSSSSSNRNNKNYDEPGSSRYENNKSGDSDKGGSRGGGSSMKGGSGVASSYANANKSSSGDGGGRDSAKSGDSAGTMTGGFVGQIDSFTSGSNKNTNKCGHSMSSSKYRDSKTGYSGRGGSKSFGKYSGGSKSSSGSKGSGSSSGSKSYSSGSRTTGKSYRSSHSNRRYDSRKSSSKCDVLNLDLRPNNDILRTNKCVAVSNTESAVLRNDVNRNRADTDSVMEVVSYGQPEHGVLEITDDGFVYTPDCDFEGLDTIDYAVGDTVHPGVNTATIGVLVGNAGNVAPFLEDDSFDVMVGEPLTVGCAQILENDFDWNMDRMTVVDFTEPTHGRLRRNGGGACGFTYTPDDGFLGEDTVLYTVKDDRDGQSVATITIRVKYPNRPPTAVDDTITVEGDAYEFDPRVIMANDSDPEGMDLVVTEFTEPPFGQGLLTRTADGTFVYLPQGFSGRTSFTYTVADPDGGTAAATVYLNVAVGNSAPVARDDDYSTPVNTVLEIDAVDGVLANDGDVDGDDLTVESATEPRFGNLKKIKWDGSLKYEPEFDFQGVDVFTYTVVDGKGGETTAYVTVEVGNPNGNRPPRAVDDRYVVPSNSNGQELKVLNNDVDTDGDFLIITNTPTRPSHGDITEDRNGMFLEYKPDFGFVGTDTFQYTVTDGKGGTDTATVTIDVRAPQNNNNNNNNNVVAVNDAYTVFKNQLLTVPYPGVLVNDRYAGNVVVERLSPPSNGRLTLNRDGSFVYEADANFNGVDSFMYTVVDGNNNVDEARVTLTVRQSVVPPLVAPGGGNTVIVGVQGKSNDCLLQGFVDCTGVDTISNTIKIENQP